MFKTQVLRRNFSLFNRVPHSRIVRSSVRDGHETVVIQRFRIQKPFFTKSRIVGAIVITGAAYGLDQYLVRIDVEVNDEAKEKTKRFKQRIKNEEERKEAKQDGDEVEENDEDDEDDKDDEEDVEDDDDDALIFLPTGFSRAKPPTFYKGSDPEWQEFRKMVTDRPRVEKIRNELASMMRDVAAKTPAYVARLGKVDTSKGKVWIEFRFPDGPPPEYERPGIELTDELEWRKATRPVEPLHHQRLKKLLVPTEASSAIYQHTKRKLGESWKNFRVYIGWEEKPDQTPAQRLRQEITQAFDTKSPPSSPVLPPNSATQNPLSTSAANVTKHPAASPSTAPGDTSAKHVGTILPKLTIDPSLVRQDIRKAFKPYAMQPPRGSFLVVGLIEVYGDRARMTINVAAVYDPKQGRYMGMRAGVWNLADHHQSPRGGR